MNIEKTNIEGLLIIEPDVYRDERGCFLESYNRERYCEAGVSELFVQDNVSVSKKGVIRGLHYQAPPFALGKLVSVLQGRVMDVAVDIRTGSPTYGQHVMVELSADNHKQFWIPAGFAHGFVALEDDTVFTYKCTNVYSKEHDRGIHFDDPALGIDWGVADPVVSEKDRQHPLLADIQGEFIFKNPILTA
ncbi:MAG: dTDP-4-dehydrorhamnose 3,5-epimerase [Candidatus Moraniibacteriota bacterium]